ncbi:unnamed protein product [Linum tenue]|uniref:Uncharacterized protein n=1 Tax=Linum tenue TaxID=586396 RepID=A0AAV0Q5P5_9ROSI|nr:unnamed protein product [Linum tenue]CAI0380291.1 unnamed protein product [Linum tenue]CAI0425258.1 unnamed protein product [Linum tenue]CAI0430610.1 unnamed protein product [Linum tenue]CAI0432151.1 unnamed protein product [Linum tenue]
MAKGDTLLQFS